MKLTIDRNENIILPVAGKSVKTGWVAIGYHGIDNNVKLSRGNGYQSTINNFTTHHTDMEEPAIWQGQREDLTVDFFTKITGWNK